MLCISNHLKYLKSWRIIKIHLLANTFETFLYGKQKWWKQESTGGLCVTDTHTAGLAAAHAQLRIVPSQPVPTCAPTFIPSDIELLFSNNEEKQSKEGEHQPCLGGLLVSPARAVPWLGRRWFYIQPPLVVSVLTFFLNKLLLICCHNCDNKVLFLLFNGHGKLKLKECACYS